MFTIYNCKFGGLPLHCYICKCIIKSFIPSVMEHFIEKLEKILQYYGLTASGFADRVGVQRSSLSHLLSGRNKPSLDFILKIIDAFPEVDLNWILLDQGTFPKSKNTPTPTETISSENKEIAEASKTSESEIKSLHHNKLELFDEEEKIPKRTSIPQASLAEAFPDETKTTSNVTAQNSEVQHNTSTNLTEIESSQTVQLNTEGVINQEVENKFISTNIIEQPAITTPTEEKIEKVTSQERVLENNEIKNPLVQAMLQKDAIEMIAVLFKDGTFKEYWKKS
jgi:transcriptional regulator with XRE-family HTH domain